MTFILYQAAKIGYFLLNERIISNYLVIWRNFVWLFGAISFGYLARHQLDNHINKHMHHHFLKQKLY